MQNSPKPPHRVGVASLKDRSFRRNTQRGARRFKINRVRQFNRARRSGAELPQVWKGMLWVALSGLLFTCLNTIVRHITLTLDGFESQFLRYFFGFLVMVPLLLKEGWRSYIPVDMKGQFWRGAVHTLGLLLWFAALPKIALADMTAIGFSGPIFIMIGGCGSEIIR